MSVLILGAEGMLGSALMTVMPSARGTVRGDSDDPRVHAHVDILKDLRFVLDWERPRVIINCAGIVKSECTKHSEAHVMAVNAEAPHRIAELADAYRCRMIQVSTDCVFSGLLGNRVEEDKPDATDLYGRSKAKGELAEYKHCITVRTSFVGPDRRNGRGLLEWLLSSRAPAPGYTRALWSGLSTHELARAIMLLLARFLAEKAPAAVYHIAGPVISKADLLQTLVDAYDMRRPILRADEPHLDRSLYGGRFNGVMGYNPPTWVDMARELARKG